MWGFGFKYWLKKGLIVVRVHMEPCCIRTWLVIYWALLLHSKIQQSCISFCHSKSSHVFPDLFSETPVPSFWALIRETGAFSKLVYRELRSLLLLPFSSLCWGALLRKANLHSGQCIKGKVSFRKSWEPETAQKHITVTLIFGILKEEWPGTVVVTYHVLFLYFITN